MCHIYSTILLQYNKGISEEEGSWKVLMVVSMRIRAGERERQTQKRVEDRYDQVLYDIVMLPGKDYAGVECVNVVEGRREKGRITIIPEDLIQSTPLHDFPFLICVSWNMT